MCIEYYIFPGIAIFGIKMEDFCENMVVTDGKLGYNKKKCKEC